MFYFKEKLIYYEFPKLPDFLMLRNKFFLVLSEKNPLIFFKELILELSFN